MRCLNHNINKKSHCRVTCTESVNELRPFQVFNVNDTSPGDKQACSQLMDPATNVSCWRRIRQNR